jgi:hypothetical protein
MSPGFEDAAMMRSSCATGFCVGQPSFSDEIPVMLGMSSQMSWSDRPGESAR